MYAIRSYYVQRFLANNSPQKALLRLFQEEAPFVIGDMLAVRDDSIAARAGLEAADLIVAVDGRTLARDTARRPFDRFEQQP